MDSQTFAEPYTTPEGQAHYFHWNTVWYHAIFLAIDCLNLVLMILIGRHYAPLAQWGLPAAYTLMTLAQPHLLLERLDVGLMMFLLLWTYCSIRSQSQRATADWWACAGYLFLGLGISYKLIPLICIPFLLLADFWVARSLWRFGLMLLLLGLGAVGPFLLQMRSSGWAVLDVFRYHSEREINLESTWAGLMLACRPFGVPMEVVFGHGGYNLTGPWRGTIKTVASLSLLGMGAILGLWALWRGRQLDRQTARDISYLALIKSMVLSPVFSPQYLDWALPVALLLALDVFPWRRSPWLLFSGLAVAIVAISSWIFPIHHPELREFDPLAVRLTITRSACLVALGLLLSLAFWNHFGLLGPRRDHIDERPTAAAA